MTYHLTINGRPLCEHTACQAGTEDARAVPALLHCGYEKRSEALHLGALWVQTHPHHKVAVIDGPCPMVAED